MDTIFMCLGEMLIFFALVNLFFLPFIFEDSKIFGWCPKMYAASNKSVVDIEKSDSKCFEVIEHLLGKTAGFTHRTAYPLA